MILFENFDAVNNLFLFFWSNLGRHFLISINFKVVSSPKAYKGSIDSILNMTKEYNPTRKEILREVVNGVSLKNTGSKLKQAGGDFIAAASIFSLCPYIFPTTIRVRNDIKSSGEKVKLDVTDHIGFGAGIIAAIGSYVAQAGGYLYAVKHDHPEALLIPVVTNVVSGAYEIGRKAYNNTRQKLISKHNKNLESVLETTESTRE